MTLTEIVKKVKFAATQHLLTLRSKIKGRGFEKFKKQYLIQDVIGSGGFGVVYSGYKISTYQPVAIKFVERRQVIEWGKLEDERLPMEICMLNRCSNVQGVIELLEWFTVPDGFLIIMERPMVSIDLYGFIIENGYLNEELSRFLALQIIQTTQECMKVCKVIHRDIKNENLIIDLVTGQIKLIDFGAATYLKTTKYHGFQGTRLYCPPEWFSHSVYLGFEATVWSLGIIFYSMLNGQLPFLNEKDICTKHLLGPLPKFVEYSNEADDLVQRCLSYEPFRRIKLDKLRRHSWFAIKTTSSWDTMLSNLVIKNADSKLKNSSSTSKESGVNTSMDKPANNQRQNASLDEQQESRQNESMTMFPNKPMLMQQQANTCIIGARRNKHNKHVENQMIRSKSTRITPVKLRNRSNDSGNDSFVQSCSQSPVTSPLFPTSINKFVL